MSLSTHFEPKIRDLKDKETKVCDAKTSDFLQLCPLLKGPKNEPVTNLWNRLLSKCTVIIHFHFLFFLAVKVNVIQLKKVK